jgi:hypothetical protein
VVTVTKKIRRALGAVGAFLRRKLEVWFVLVILAILGASGWLVLDRLGSTQAALCRAAHSSAETKDRFVDVFARAFDVDEANPFIVEMRSYVAQEREQLVGECPTPTRQELTP